MKKTIGINGFGRIGRTLLRVLLSDKTACENLNIALINIGPHEANRLDYLFAYDSVMGPFPGTVQFTNNTLTINNHSITITNKKSPDQIPWKNTGIEWVIEASGKFTERALAEQHLNSGAQKVIITAPATDEDVCIIPGVNDADYKPETHTIISLGSCTTNCFAPMIKVIEDAFSIKDGMMTTIHAYTNDQKLLDNEHKDPRRARAAALNIIPTKTGAANTIIKIFPQLKERILARAIRVPVPLVSLVDFVFTSDTKMNAESINKAFKQGAHGKFKGIIEYSQAPLVSSDFIGNPHSVIIDSLLTQATKTIGKIFGWYDNEYGYCCRVKDFLLHNR